MYQGVPHKRQSCTVILQLSCAFFFRTTLSFNHSLLFLYILYHTFQGFAMYCAFTMLYYTLFLLWETYTREHWVQQWQCCYQTIENTEKDVAETLICLAVLVLLEVMVGNSAVLGLVQGTVWWYSVRAVLAVRSIHCSTCLDVKPADRWALSGSCPGIRNARRTWMFRGLECPWLSVTVFNVSSEPSCAISRRGTAQLVCSQCWVNTDTPVQTDTARPRKDSHPNTNLLWFIMPFPNPIRLQNTSERAARPFLRPQMAFCSLSVIWISL